MVDYIRRPYRVLARPFKDSEETAEMVWYPALPDAPTLPFPTVFNSLEYQPFPLAKTSPGEVPFVDRIFTEQRPKPHATGNHQCGSPEAFLDGISYDPAAVVPYNDDGLPVCCVGWERGPCSCSAPGAIVAVEPPGDTCETALEFAHGAPVVVTVPAGETRWFRCATGLSGPQFIKQVAISGEPYTQGGTGSCDSWSLLGPLPGTHCYSIFFVGVLAIWLLRTINDTDDDWVFSLQAGSGTCP